MTEEKEQKKGYEVVQVPVEHRLAIQTPNGELMNELEVLTHIANELEELKKGLVG